MMNERRIWLLRSPGGQLLLTGLLTIGSGVYTYLFWKSPLGFNTLLYAAFLSVMIWLLHPEFRVCFHILLTMLSVILSAIAVMWEHSLLAQIIHVVSIFLLLGFAQARSLRFFVFAFLLVVGCLPGLSMTWRRR